VSEFRKIEQKMNALGHAIIPFNLDPEVPGLR
jgi:hypothetical protein